MTLSVGRNDPCPCESGRKYKRCCSRLHERVAAARRRTNAALAESGERHEYAEEIAALLGEIIEALDAGRFDDAGALACDLLEDYPQEAEGLEMLGHVHAALGEREQALGWYRKALAVVLCVYEPGQHADMHERWLRRALHAVDRDSHPAPWYLSLEDGNEIGPDRR